MALPVQEAGGTGRFRASELSVGSFFRSSWRWAFRLDEAPDELNVPLGTCPGHVVWSFRLVKLHGLVGLLEKSRERIHQTALRRGAGGHRFLPEGSEGSWGQRWAGGTWRQPLPPRFSSVCSCPSPGLGFSAAPVVPGCWCEGGLSVWCPQVSLAGVWFGGIRGDGAAGGMSVLWLLPGAAGSCFESGLCEASAARAGPIPGSFAAAHVELENEQNPPPCCTHAASWALLVLRSPHASLPWVSVAPWLWGSGCTARGAELWGPLLGLALFW